jgi:DNA-binding transcriptional MocR family regulator
MLATVTMERREGSHHEIADQLLPKLGDWTARSGPIYIRLGTAIADAHAHGLFGPACRLPSERALSARLRVSRGTVVAAYEHLRERGVAETRRGSGTWLTQVLPGPMPHQSPLLSRLVDQRQVPIDLSICTLQLEDGPPDITVKLSDAARLLPAHGYSPLGAVRLRQAIAKHMTTRRGVPTRADEVVVTSGGSGALSLIAQALLRPGDRILTEAPTYPGALEIFSRAGASVEAIERDHAGALPDALERALASRPTRMLYLVPTCHNPTGGVMSELRRREVMRIAGEWGTPIIEDTVMADLLTIAPPPDLAALDPDRVLSVGSLSKCFWGGLRVGWIRTSAETILRLGRARATVDLGSPALSQAAAVQVLESFSEATERPRMLAVDRLRVLVAELRAQIPEWSFPSPAGGLSVWISLPSGNVEELAQLALRRGVAISSGRAAAPDDRFSGHMRICAGPSAELIREGVTQLAAAWRQVGLSSGGLSAQPSIPV